EAAAQRRVAGVQADPRVLTGVVHTCGRLRVEVICPCRLDPAGGGHGERDVVGQVAVRVGDHRAEDAERADPAAMDRVTVYALLHGHTRATDVLSSCAGHAGDRVRDLAEADVPDILGIVGAQRGRQVVIDADTSA